MSRRNKIEAKQVVDGVYTEECEAHSHEVEHHEGNPIGAQLFSYGEGPWDSALCLLDDLPQVFDSLTDQDVNISAESIKLRECLLVKVRWECLMTSVTVIIEYQPISNFRG